MLMRHGVRPPTKPQVTPEGTHPQPWPSWDAGYGELTGHGYDAIRLLGQWDRRNWVARGLLPAEAWWITLAPDPADPGAREATLRVPPTAAEALAALIRDAT